MRKIHLSVALIIVTGSFFLSGCQSIGSKAVTSPEVLAAFEITDDTNNILLPVKFQGEEYQFLLDTGSDVTAYDDSFKDKLRKMFIGPVTRTGRAPHGKKIKYVTLPAPDAYLGQLNLKVSRYAVVTDLNQLVAEENRNFQGIIGMDFLKKYIIQIDFDNEKVIFFKGNKDIDLFSFLKPKENKHPEWGEPIPLKTKLFHNVRYIRGKFFDNTSADFLIDTGNYFSNDLQSRLFEKVNSNLVGTQHGSQSTTTVQSDNKGRKVIITERFSVGTFEYKEMFFQKSDSSILGQPFLSRHLVTFDFPNNVAYLKKGRDFDKLSIPPIVIEGLELTLQYSGDEIIVSFVDPNGPAYRKGIRQKDILLKINDQDVSSFSIVEFLEFLSQQISMPKDGVLTFAFKHGDDIKKYLFKKSDNVKEKDETD